ncbi:general transcription factor IIH subunit TFB5 family protein [Candidatus Dependentiae bacterium]|nr:general transcription factor IIH subunit TFB5 family protein [Candidatus Dependentiae bacterium]
MAPREVPGWRANFERYADEDAEQHEILDHKMVSAVHGSLIETDIPCKVYILHINEKLPPAERFVIQDLDETHLLVQPHRLEYVKAEVKAWQQKNQYTPPADLKQ